MYFTISSYLYVCSAIFAKFMASWISLIIDYNLNMHCNCQRKERYKQELLKRDQTIVFLKEQSQIEKANHLTEIRQINESIEAYAKEKNKENEEISTKNDMLNKKIMHYKQKCCKLNEKIKESSDLVKTLMEKKISLEADIIRCREELAREREKMVEITRYKSEMKQIISLQEIQNAELVKKIKYLRQQIDYLKNQITGFSEIKDKFMNIESIAENQYQRQIGLLKEKLEHEFCKSTNDILNQIVPRELNDTVAIRQIRNFNEETIKGQYRPSVNLEYEELKKLSNYVDYGSHYFLLENSELTLYQSMKVFKYIVSLLRDKTDLQDQLQETKESMMLVSNQLKSKTTQIQQRLDYLSCKTLIDQETQTAELIKINQIINLNTHMKVKLYDLQNILALMSNFVAFLLKYLQACYEKDQYFRFTQSMLYRSLKPSKRSKFRKVSISLLFIQILSKKARKTKRLLIDAKLSRQTIKQTINNSELNRYLYSFYVDWKKNHKVKNHKIDQILKQKSNLSPQLKMAQIINQEWLNKGSNRQRYAQIFSRFIFETDRKQIKRQ